MNLHANAKPGLAGRHAPVRAVEDGMSLKQAAVCFRVTPATTQLTPGQTADQPRSQREWVGHLDG
jgi:hypothetical protein